MSVLHQTEPLVNKLRTILNNPMRVPLEYTISDISLLSASAFRSCGRLVTSHAQSKAIISPDDALADFLLTEQLESKLHSGGLLLHSLVGVALGGMSNDGMKVNLTKFSKHAREQAVLSIIRCLKEADSADQIQTRDRNWSNTIWWGTYLQNIVRTSIGDVVSQEFNPAEVALRRNSADARMMVIELLLQNYHDDNGRYPESLVEVLSVTYQEINLDPFSKSQEAFRYRAIDDGFVLYSLGENGIDDGGHFKPEPGLYLGKDHSLARYLLPAEKVESTFDAEMIDDAESFPTFDFENENAETSEPEKANQ